VIRRLLFLVLAVGALLWWLRNLTRRVQQQQSPSSGQGVPPVRDLGPMVRDRVCNTFVPKSRALTARVDSDELYFCSEECREKFFSEHTVNSA
jgi:YHS domain-containing protein